MRIPLLLALAVAAGTLRSEPSVEVVGVEGRASEARTLHLLAGQPVELKLQMFATAPGRISIRASLYQLAGGIAAPLAKDLPVAADVGFDGASLRPQKFGITPPEVRHATMMELRFAAKSEAGDAWQPAGVARFVVHPAGLFPQVKALLSKAIETAGTKVAVIGESPQLKQTLRGAGLGFDEAEAVADPAPGRLYLAECSAEAARALIAQTPPEARLLVFTSDPALPPGVYWTQRGAGFTAKVTLPVLADFEHAPDRQMLLLTLFQQALRTSQDPP